MEEKGASRVSVPGTADYRQITGTFAVTLSGDFFTIQLIYQGKTAMSQPKSGFPSEFHITQTPNHWANESTTIDLLNHILIPYVENKRKEMNLDRVPWLLISDVFKGQWTEKVKDLVRESNGKMVKVPNNWTNCFQPPDLAVNRSYKDFLRQEAQYWYSKRIVKQMQQGKKPHEIKVDVRISIAKPLHAKWIVKFYDYIRSKPELIKNGWRKSGIIDNLAKYIKFDPFA